MMIFSVPLLLAVAHLATVAFSNTPISELPKATETDDDGASDPCHADDAIKACGFVKLTPIDILVTADADDVYSACGFSCWPKIIGRLAKDFDAVACGVCPRIPLLLNLPSLSSELANTH